MIKEYKGIILCIFSCLINLISGFLIIIGSFNKNVVLVYVALGILLVGMILMVFGIYFLYNKYKDSKKHEI